MTSLRRSLPVATAMLALLVGGALLGLAQSNTPPSPKKSVYGKLERVDKSLNGLFMLSDEGKRLAWRFDRVVIEEIMKTQKPGDPMIVIYRQTSPNEKRVTAVAFPGSAPTPVYVNLTGARVKLRSAPMVGGVCTGINLEAVQESTIPSGGRAEAPEACWCCAPVEDSCTPANKTGAGRALLSSCFE